MSVNPALITHLQQRLSAITQQQVNIHHSAPVSGGSINDAYCLHTSIGKCMLKMNNKTAYPDMFFMEARGLKNIAETHTIAVPEVIYCGDFGNLTYLILEWIETGTSSPNASLLLGQHLAAMHQHQAQEFGFAYDNYMGPLPQSNKKHSTWTSFFINERLKPMVKIGWDKKLLLPNDFDNFEKLYMRLPGLFTEEAPALLHGDLWSGNYLISSQGKPYLIDPAVSYGHREFDIAMTTLFGGFNNHFYEAYQAAFPLNNGWQQRLDLWNLYPLLLHLNLFGLGYLNKVRGALTEYL